jgi:MbtH protein
LANTFADENGMHLVLVNAEGQHSLWPQSIGIPAGWTSTYGPDTRQACLEFVNKNWTDMRPKSLIASMAGQVPPKSGKRPS